MLKKPHFTLGKTTRKFETELVFFSFSFIYVLLLL